MQPQVASPIDPVGGSAQRGKARQYVTELFGSAGIEVNGAGPADIHVHDERFYSRFVRDHTLGLGESYMEGWWDCSRVDQFTERFARAELFKRYPYNLTTLRYALRTLLIPENVRRKAFEVGEHHYDLGNDFFEKMLDSRMVYSCGYWKAAENLDEAQHDKLDLICKKLGLKQGMTLLDVGCGWGSLARYAAENYGVRVVGITVSREQLDFARERCRGLPVELRLQDYRDLSQQFDRVASVGMFEHVGARNLRLFMKVVSRCLRDDGLFLLQTSGCNETLPFSEPWMKKYIFPNSYVPSQKELSDAMDGIFVAEDLHNFGPYYDRTLMAWCENFDRAWDEFSGVYDEKFRRMWRYYLLKCAGYFRARTLQLWQWTLSKNGCRQVFADLIDYRFE